jgi:hypothetical protein
MIESLEETGRDVYGRLSIGGAWRIDGTEEGDWSVDFANSLER